MRNFCGRGKELTDVVNGELVRWTRSSRSLDTRPLKEFIMKSIHSFIICISVTMWGGAISAVDGRLVSCRSGPSWSLRSALVRSWSSSWVLSPMFFWRSYFSRSWFCLVGCSTTTAWVWTYLSRAAMRGSSLWWLLVVAIEWVSTMQLFVREMLITACFLSFFP